MNAIATSTDELEALTQFLYMAPIGLVEATLEGVIVMINPMSAQLLLPLSRDGELRNLFDALVNIAPDLRHRARVYGERHGRVCDDVHLQIDAGTPGRPPQILSLTLLKLDANRLMAVLNDVSLSVQRDRALRHSQAWLDTIISGINDYALVGLDCDGKVQSWNTGIRRLTGHSAADCVGHPYAVFYPEDTLPPARIVDRIHEADRDGWSLDEGWRQRADGSRFWGSCLIAPLDLPNDPQAGEPAYSLIVRDISDRKDAHEALRRSVCCDHLTGLANRRAFFDAAEQEWRRWQRLPRPLSIAVFDADHFKRVNDAYGHAAGDAVLRHLAVALGAGFRAQDVVARLGGEEFAILLPGTSVDDARAIASALCQTIAARAVDIAGTKISCTLSAGIAGMALGVDSVQTLLNRADSALYLAKQRGRNRVEAWTAEGSVSQTRQTLHPHRSERQP